jgi:hypothetical protein
VAYDVQERSADGKRPRLTNQKRQNYFSCIEMLPKLVLSFGTDAIHDSNNYNGDARGDNANVRMRCSESQGQIWPMPPISLVSGKSGRSTSGDGVTLS